MRRLMFCLMLMIARFAFAQGDFAPPPSKDDPLQIKNLKPLPSGVLLLPGATPSASDSKTPLPESGNIHNNVYENSYFGIGYPFPKEWFKEFDGPPPSDTGGYVLAELVPSASFKGASKGSILITAQDLFFSLTPANTSSEMIKYTRGHLPSYYKAEREPSEFKIGERTVARFDYMSPVAGLHWYVLATEVRCHIVQFVFTSQDTALLNQLIEDFKTIKLPAADVPLCVANFARAENIVYRVDPVLTDTKYNPIPVRIVIGKNGRVHHVHVLSAFASQAQIVTDALLQWRFKPYLQNGEPVVVETGILFGSAKSRKREPGPATASITSD